MSDQKRQNTDPLIPNPQSLRSNPQSLALPRFTQPLVECREIGLVGGKAANLGRLLRAGFPVPGGFVVTTRAYRLALESGRSNGEAKPQAARPAVPPEVAERSPGVLPGDGQSGGGGSLVGYGGGFLHRRQWPDNTRRFSTCRARRPWSPRSSDVGPDWLPRGRWPICANTGSTPAAWRWRSSSSSFIPADVAGVLFTTNPSGIPPREMLLEASWGLGEAVVSGQVQPDALRLDWASGRVLAATIADKHVRAAGGSGLQPVAEEVAGGRV